MAYSDTSRVTIVSLVSGQLLLPPADSGSQFNPGEPAIITLQGAPSQVSSYQQQNDDLILQMQDGSDIRYQQFFTVVDGKQSELRFQQENSLQQAVFAETSPGDTQTAASLTPAWQTLDSVASTAASGETQPASTLTAAPSAVTAESAEAPVSTEASVETLSTTSLPQLTINPVTGDNAVNYQEGVYGIEFTGTAAGLPNDTPVTLTLDGKTWTGSVYNGEWLVQINDDEVATIKDGTYNVTVSTADGASISQDLLLITHYNSSNPTVTVNDVTLANAVDHDGQTWYTLTGTMEMPLPLKSFSVQSLETMSWREGVINADGSWSVEVSADDLREGFNNLNFGVLDGAGNWFEQGVSVNADLTTPVDAGGSSVEALALVAEVNPTDGETAQPAEISSTSLLPELTLNSVTGDNAVSYREGIYGIEFSGTAANLANDTPIELTLNGKTWTGGVYNGAWMIQINDDEVAAIKDGTYQVTVSATDSDGNGTSLSQDLLLITHYNSSNPTVTVNDITLGNVVDHDGQTWYTLTGTMEMPLPLKSFAVQSYEMMSWREGVINADGSWSVEVSADDVGDGFNNLTFGVLDGAGNWFEQGISFNADLTTPVDANSVEAPAPVVDDNPTDAPVSGGAAESTEPAAVSGKPSLTINSFTGDAVLSAAEKQSDQTLSGTTKNLAAESTLTIKLNGATYTTKLATDGSWSVDIPAADLQVLPVGANRISVSFANSAGGTTTASKNITVEASVPPADAPHPQPTIDTPFGDGLMNSQEHYQATTLTGSTGVTGAGQKIALTIDGVSYAGSVDSEGHWSVPLSLETLRDASLDEGAHTITLTATDVWGQTGTATSDFSVDTQAPTVTVNTLAGDGLIDATEISSPLVIAGTGEAGSAINVKFGEFSWNGTIDSNGRWQVSVPAATLQGMEEGSYNAIATVTDKAGNHNSNAATVQIYASEELPELTLNPVTGDNAISYREGIYGIEFIGTATHLPTYTAIELTMDGKTWGGSVYQNEWRVQIGSEDVAAIKDGNYKVTVSATDQNGNSTSISQDLLLITHYNSSNPQVTVNEMTLANAVEHDGQTWYTLSGTMEMPLPLKLFAVQSTEMLSWHEGVINADGSWSVEVSADDLRDGSNSLVFGVSDGAGNWFEQDISFNADLTTPVGASGGAAETPVPVIDDNPTDGDTTTPAQPQADSTLTINPVTGDNAVSYQEGINGIEFTGTAAGLPNDTALTLTLDGKTWTGSVYNGEWLIQINDDEVAAIKDGTYSVTVSTAAGTSVSQDLLLITHNNSSNPTVTVHDITLANAVDHDGQTWYTLTGTMEMPLPLKSFSVQSLETMSWREGVINADGSWSVEVSAADLREGFNNMNFGVSDGAGNWFEQPISVNADLTTPAEPGGGTEVPVPNPEDNPSNGTPEPTINTPFGDGVLNRAEKLHNETLTGTTGILGTGQVVTVIIGGKSHAATVANNGEWSLLLTPTDMKQGFGNGLHKIVVIAADAVAHKASIETSYTVDTVPPKVTIDTPFGDSILTLAEKQQNETLTGTIDVTGGEQRVRVVIGGVAHWATVTDEGHWSLALTPADMQQGFGDGKHGIQVTAFDAAGNSATINTSYVVDSTLSVASSTIEDTATAAKIQVADSSATSTMTEQGSEETSSVAVAQSSHSENIDGLAQIVGTEADDHFTLSTLNLLSNLNGGGGQDTLVLNGSHETLDFASLGLKISSVETIDLGSFGSNSITLGQKDLLALTDNGSETLTIKGADGNAVTLSTAEGGVWNNAGQQTVDGQQFDLYHNASASHEGTLADILIQHNLQVQTA
ncbi:BapA prefix-like domain-containing protein [Kalamiella sp. sgz302252]|uniref:BapA prefix-like domain-containing protein n=1 Tax=Pantoea sp. sgz302252 TaxID=3341827 RepID=UPI0036D2DCD6